MQQCFFGTDIDVACLRFQNVYGAGTRLTFTGVISIMSQIALADRQLNVFEDGQIARDFVHVSDVVEALIRAGQPDRDVRRPINIGTGEVVTITRMAQKLLSELGKDLDTTAFRAIFGQAMCVTRSPTFRKPKKSWTGKRRRGSTRECTKSRNGCWLKTQRPERASCR